MIYPTPAFRFKNLFKSSAKSVDAWSIKEYSLSWHNSGSDILAFLSDLVIKKTNPVFLLPGFFCSQSLKGLRFLEAKFIFYKLTSDLRPDYKDINSILKKHNVDFFIHIHYFGKHIDQVKTRKICDENRIIMIEDCAHLISPVVSKKWLGDFIFFSPHKFFPIPYGSCLFSKKELTSQTNFKYNSLKLTWFMKSFSKNFFQNKLFFNNSLNLEFSQKVEKPNYLVPHQRIVNSLYINNKTLFNMANTRKRNLKVIEDIFFQSHSWIKIMSFDTNDIPYVVGYQAKSKTEFLRKKEKLLSSKCPAMVWPDLPIELKIHDNHCIEDIYRTKHSIYFFLHEQINIFVYRQMIKNIFNV